MKKEKLITAIRRQDYMQIDRTNQQNNDMSNTQSVNQNNKKEKNHSFNISDVGLSSALNLFTPKLKDSNNEQSIKQLTNKKKYKGGGEIKGDIALNIFFFFVSLQISSYMPAYII